MKVKSGTEAMSAKRIRSTDDILETSFEDEDKQGKRKEKKTDRRKKCSIS